MTADHWQMALSVIGTAAIPICLFSMLLLRLTLDRRIRKALPKDKVYDSIFDAYFGFGRAISFGWASIATYFNNSSKLRSAYNNFDVKTFANRFEKTVAYCMVASGFLLIFSGSLVYLTHWLGIFYWPDMQ